MAQLRFPLPTPIGSQAERHSHANDANQPEPETKSSCRFRIGHPPRSTRAATPPSDQLWPLGAREPNTPATRSPPTEEARRQTSMDLSRQRLTTNSPTRVSTPTRPPTPAQSRSAPFASPD